MSQVNKQTLAQKLEELDTVLAWFDSDDIDLELALEKFEAGSKLADDIRSRLDDVHNKIIVLEKRFDVSE